MKTLLLMRHAKSSWKNPGLADHVRPLNSRGKSDASKIGKFLTELGILPDAIVSSTAKRARQTIEHFLNECPFNGEVHYLRSLYHGGTDDFIEVLRKFDDNLNIVMIVCHNPGIEYAVEDFCGVDEIIPTSAIVQITFNFDRWSDIKLGTIGELVSVFRPKEI